MHGKRFVPKKIRSQKNYGNSLRIHLYNDEFEVVNPIGSKRGTHKMNATYFTLGNLPSKYSSQLKHIHLVNIVKHKAVKAEGYAATFAPLVNELKQLFADGFDIYTHDDVNHRQNFVNPNDH